MKTRFLSRKWNASSSVFDRKITLNFVGQGKGLINVICPLVACPSAAVTITGDWGAGGFPTPVNL